MNVIRLFGYFLAEGMKGLWRSKALHLFALFVVASSLYILGFARYVTQNLSTLLESWQGGLEVRLFLRAEVTPDRVAELEGKYSREPAVAGVRFISPGEALEILSKFAPAFGEASDALPQNPLPPSLSLRLRSPINFERVKALTLAAEKEPGVDQVLFDWEWVDRLRSYTRFVSLIGWLLFSVLGAAALFTVGAITKILALSRREEIEILHFMGATGLTVRGPFVAGGVVLGLLSGAAALLLLAATHAALRHAGGPQEPLLSILASAPLSLRDQLLLGLSGGLLGGLGGGFSAAAGEHSQ